MVPPPETTGVNGQAAQLGDEVSLTCVDDDDTFAILYQL